VIAEPNKLKGVLAKHTHSDPSRVKVIQKVYAVVDIVPCSQSADDVALARAFFNRQAVRTLAVLARVAIVPPA